MKQTWPELKRWRRLASKLTEIVERVNFEAHLVENDPRSMPDEMTGAKSTKCRTSSGRTRECRRLPCNIGAFLLECGITLSRHIVYRVVDALPSHPTPGHSGCGAAVAGTAAGERGEQPHRCEVGTGNPRRAGGRRGWGGAPGTGYAVAGRDALEPVGPSPTRGHGRAVCGNAGRGELGGDGDCAGPRVSRAKGRAGAGYGKARPGGASPSRGRGRGAAAEYPASERGARSNAAGAPPTCSPLGRAAHLNGPKGRAAGGTEDHEGGGKPLARTAPGRRHLRFLVLEALAGGGGGSDAGLWEIAASIATAHHEVGSAAPGGLPPNERMLELGRGVKLATGDMEHAGLVQIGAGGRMQITASGRALLGKIGEMAGGAGSAGAPTQKGSAAGRWKAKPAISDRFLRELSPAYREWQDGGPEEGAAGRGADYNAKMSSGIVAVIDMLGTAKAWKTRDLPELQRLWNKLSGFTEDVLRPEEGFAVTTESDAIIVTGSGHSAADLLRAFGGSSWRIVVRGLQIGVPMRGCVAAGEYCASPRGLVMGKTVDEAKRWHGRARWIGITATPSAGSVLDEVVRADAAGTDPVRRCYAKYDIPSKLGMDAAWAVNWPWQCEETGMGGGAAEMMRIIRDGQKKAPDDDAALKWANTGKFCGDMISGWDPFT